MAKINRSDAIQRAVSGLGLNPSENAIPSDTLDKVQTTFDIDPRVNKIESLPAESHIIRTAGNSSSGTSTTLYNTPNLQGFDFFLTSLTLSMIKDATCDAATSSTAGVRIGTTISGTARSLLIIPTLTLTAQYSIIYMPFPTPIKVDKNVIINITNATFTAGSCVINGVVTGYLTKTQYY